MDRTEQVIMSRIRIGHRKLNNTLKIMGKHPTGQCSCGERETVEHVMIACPRYGRETLFGEQDHLAQLTKKSRFFRLSILPLIPFRIQPNLALF